MVMEFIKYASLVSFPIFGLIFLLILSGTKNYSLKESTISQAIFSLSEYKYKQVFKVNFIIKGILDFCFALFVLNAFNVPKTSIFYWISLISSILFGSIAYFTEDKNRENHLFVTYTSGVFWFINTIYFSFLTSNCVFTTSTIILAIVLLAVSFYVQKTSKINAIIQSIIVFFMCLWVFFFVELFL